MAEERNVSLARAGDSADDDVDQTKAALQRRMEEARESISQTVTEIKDTVVNQYQQVKENISDTLDWREQYKRHTLPFTVGAFAAGALLGYTLMGAFKGGDEEDYDEEGEYESGEALHAYAASPVLGRSRGYSAESGEDVGPSPRPSYSSGYSAPTAPQALASYAEASKPAAEEEEEPKGPGLLERFKETKAYDRLTDELSTVGERVVEELSRTATTVVVPMLLNKLKSLIGVDLSQQRGGGSRQSVGSQPSSAGASNKGASDVASQGAQVKENASAGASGSASGASGTASGASGSTARAAGAGGTEGYGAS